MQSLQSVWRLQYIIKCKSTENELSKWLKNEEIQINKPLAIIAREQFGSFGQNSRKWVSPRGGIWISAAYPIFSSEFSTEIFSLSLGIKLCEIFRKENIKVNLKWPNDIYYGSKKLIGFLPRVITRGKEITYVRVGIGMNLLNRTPIEGISLSKILNSKNIKEHLWTAKILSSFHDSINLNDKREYVIEAANKFLTKKYLPTGFSHLEWTIEDIDFNGNLRLFNQSKKKILIKF